MEHTPRKRSSLNTTTLTENEYSTISPFYTHSQKRFSRSKSNQNSRSKEKFKAEKSCHFYVKNICPQMLKKKEQNISLMNKIQIPRQTQQRILRRAGTPAKSKQLIDTPPKSSIIFQENLQQQLYISRIQQQLKQSISKNQRIQQTKQQLQQKITSLSLQLAQIMNQNCYLKEKIKHLEHRQVLAKDSSLNQASKIKKRIIDSRDSEGTTRGNLDDKTHNLLAENKQMLQRLKNQQKIYTDYYSSKRRLTDQQELFLQELVQQMKIELSQKQETIKKMLIQLNIFLVRQSRSGQRSEVQRSEEMESLKKKYSNILKKYHQVNQELATYKRQGERKNNLFSILSRKNSTDSLTFSP